MQHRSPSALRANSLEANRALHRRAPCLEPPRNPTPQPDPATRPCNPTPQPHPATVPYAPPILFPPPGILACLDGYMNIAMEQTEVRARVCRRGEGRRRGEGVWRRRGRRHVGDRGARGGGMWGRRLVRLEEGAAKEPEPSGRVT